MECSFGTILTSGKCNGIVNCQQYAPGGRSSCQTCFNGFLSVGSSCLVLEACLNVLNNSGCGGCSDGYVLSGFVCVRSGNSPIPGCAVLTPMQSCQYCFDGYQRMLMVAASKELLEQRTSVLLTPQTFKLLLITAN